ncbi:hypothetical protein [Amycolatopsis sp. WGS_07]|uniref:hypothetical protein n=1 Tax=Amycolatopsis sp. WGS_07 TaxID=3076764 RepID=UPI003872E5BA
MPADGTARNPGAVHGGWPGLLGDRTLITRGTAAVSEPGFRRRREGTDSRETMHREGFLL